MRLLRGAWLRPSGFWGGKIVEDDNVTCMNLGGPAGFCNGQKVLWLSAADLSGDVSNAKKLKALEDENA